VTAKELKEELDQGQDPYLLDVRNPVEYEISRIEGSHLIPLDQLLNRLNELDSARDIVAHCRTGARSAKAIEMLQEAGFRKLRNLKGGVLAWADDVDPTMAKY
jgi:adenylyltransferase/sulfurtransferase